MSESELSQGKKWLEEQLRVRGAAAGVVVQESKWAPHGGGDFFFDRQTLLFSVAGQEWFERFSRDNLEDCINDRRVRQDLEWRLDSIIQGIKARGNHGKSRKPLSVLSLNDDEAALLSDLFTGFVEEGRYPSAPAFERAQHRLGRIEAFDSLKTRWIIIEEDGQIVFTPRWYLEHRLGRGDKDKVVKLVPVLKEMLDDEDSLHPVVNLQDHIPKPALPLFQRPPTLQRILRVLEWMKLVKDFVEVDEAGKKIIVSFRISRNVLRYTTLDQHIEQHCAALFFDEETLAGRRAAHSTKLQNAPEAPHPPAGIIRSRDPKKGTCFVVIASDRDGAVPVHEVRFRDAIAPAVVAAGYAAIRNVDGHHPNWFAEMIQHLRTCELAVVDLTDLRPNCVWELGILNAWDVPVVLVQPKGIGLPSDIFTQRVSVFYEGGTQEDLRSLKERLEKKILSVMGHPDRGQFLPPLKGGANEASPESGLDGFEKALLKKLETLPWESLPEANRLHAQRLLDQRYIEEVPVSAEVLFFPGKEFAVRLTERGRAVLARGT